MDASVLNPNVCLFAKCSIFECYGSSVECVRNSGENANLFKSRVLHEQHQKFIAQFKNTEQNFNLTLDAFKKQAPRLNELFSKWRKSFSAELVAFRRSFSADSWQKLTQQDQSLHNLFECQACPRVYEREWSQAPRPKSRNYMKTNKENLTAEAITNVVTKHSTGTVKQRTAEIYNTINKSFEASYGLPFADAMQKVPELKRPTASER